ncbi:hypothetical protein EYC80_005454 [Monilinia laxa]|uniref:Transcription factor domain-containing protein n=1 Tax=Monilinia laxa TaxID=61186 RepID=A0A5N6KEE0_MONLA|nr:hypothetical protein EYC80_005454 [Monilinia laxa]
MADRPALPPGSLWGPNEVPSDDPMHSNPPPFCTPHAGFVQKSPTELAIGSRSKGGCCDWQPRTQFKNETPKVIGRMKKVSSTESSVWNSSFSPTSAESNQQGEDDTLPPFVELETDEQREKKASYHKPGTYNVIANPSSFHPLPEYQIRGLNSTNLDTNRPSPFKQHSSIGPDNIILPKFEEFSEKNGRSGHQTHSRTISLQSAVSTSGRSTSSMEKVASDARDAHLLEHYRNVLAQQICWLTDKEPGPDLFERYAENYLPLYLAIVALSALSLSRFESNSFADVLERYHRVIPALQHAAKTPEDAYSDGALFTHYLLLLFEVAATGHRKSNMWEHHSAQILRILQLRRQSFGEEPCDFISVWVTYIDMYALLTTTGTGAFSKSVIEQKMLPPPEKPLDNSKLNMVFLPEAFRQMPLLLRINRELTLMALEMAQIGRELRVEAKDLSRSITEIKMRQRNSMPGIHALLINFRVSWAKFLEIKTPEYDWLEELVKLPGGPFTCRTHIHLFYRACVIYYHTSMFQGQFLIPSTEVEEQIASCAKEITMIAKKILDCKRFEFRFLVFPVFLAGMASKIKEEKQIALDLMKSLEETSFGSNTTTTRRLLVKIYEKQKAAVAQTGNALGISWIEELESSGEPLIILGL